VRQDERQIFVPRPPEVEAYRVTKENAHKIAEWVHATSWGTEKLPDGEWAFEFDLEDGTTLTVLENRDYVVGRWDREAFKQKHDVIQAHEFNDTWMLKEG
jgi:hypothetical protein